MSSGGRAYASLQRMKSTLAPDQVDKTLGSMCMRRITMDEKNHSAVSGDALNNILELNVGEWFEYENYSATRWADHVTAGNYESLR